MERAINLRRRQEVSLSGGHRFFAMFYWRFDIKTHFWTTRFVPVFARFLSQDTMGVYPVTLSLLVRLSLFGVDLVRVRTATIAPT